MNASASEITDIKMIQLVSFSDVRVAFGRWLVSVPKMLAQPKKELVASNGISALVQPLSLLLYFVLFPAYPGASSDATFLRPG